MQPELFIHLGLPKTATTFMQHYIYPKLDGIEYLAKGKKISIDEIIQARSNKFLISSEHLFACPFSEYECSWYEEFCMNLNRLSQLFPGIRYIVSISRHERLITSYYKEYISKPRPFYMNVDEFFDPVHDNGFLKHKDFFLYSIISAVEKASMHRPFVFLQEEVGNDLDGLLSDISDYLGVDAPIIGSGIEDVQINIGVKYYQSKLLIWLNQLNNYLLRVPLLPSLYNPVFMKLGIQPDRLCRKHLSFISKRELKLTNAQRSFVQSHYRDDWDSCIAYVKRQRKSEYIQKVLT